MLLHRVLTGYSIAYVNTWRSAPIPPPLIASLFYYCYGTQSMLKTGLNILEILDKLDECEGRMSELQIDLVTDESEIKCPIKMTHQ